MAWRFLDASPTTIPIWIRSSERRRWRFASELRCIITKQRTNLKSGLIFLLARICLNFDFRSSPPWTPHRKRKLAIGAVVAALLLIVFAAVRFSSPQGALEKFWGPVLDSPDPVFVYIGGYALESPPQPVSLTDLQNSERVAYADATALARIIALMSMHHKLYRTRLQISAKLDDLKDGPAVLIGAFNNSWTLRLTGQLRFGFARDPETHVSWIQDRENPRVIKWSHQMTAPFTVVQEDYAIISRVVDPATGRVVVTASGLAKFGTEAAGEFLTNPSYIEQISRQAPRGWERRNMQIIIRANVVGRSSGPPQILLAHFW